MNPNSLLGALSNEPTWEAGVRSSRAPFVRGLQPLNTTATVDGNRARLRFAAQS